MGSALDHRAFRGGLIVLFVALGAAAFPVPPSAAEARPANDDLANARLLELPARLSGTVVGATVEPGEPLSGCGPTAGSVWYQFTAPQDRHVIVLFDASGELDAVVDLYRRNRSQTPAVDCDISDSKGQATLDVDNLVRGATYLLRVAKRPQSVDAGFRLEVLVPKPPAKPPGPRLPSKGVTDSVTRLLNPTDAWSARLKTGTTYRLNLDTRSTACTTLLVYPPGTRSFDDASPVRRLACGGYQLITPRPGGGGRYTFLVQAARRQRTPQRYHLEVARAGRDDTAPGLFIGNFRPAHGVLSAGGVDVIDLYRFDVRRRSAVTLRLHGRGRLRLLLLRDGGQRLDSGGKLIRQNLRRGRYFVVVRSDDEHARHYALGRVTRAVTRSRIVFNGRRKNTVGPGASVRIGVLVSPSVSGVVRVDVERFDPLSGWQFLERVHAGVANGKATIAFRPPGVGRYRARAVFLRTHSAASSTTLHDAHLKVAGALRQ
jgi:hypothetical protein